MRCTRLFLSLPLVLLAGWRGASMAQAPLPEGMEVGPWILAPRARISHERAENLRRTATDESRVESYTSIEAGLAASLPFRNSLLTMRYLADREFYQTYNFARDTAHDFGLTLDLQFRSSDRLKLEEQSILGFATVEQAGEGGEIAFQGEPFNSNRWTVGLERRTRSRQGYAIDVTRLDFNYEGDVNLDLYDYRGFESSYEYLFPLSRRSWWSTEYISRRFNHYNSLRVIPGTDDLTYPVGVPYRKEVSDSLASGIYGSLGTGQLFYLRAGTGTFHYDYIDSETTRSLTLEGAWVVDLSEHTSIDLSLSRRQLPSNLDTYYINEEISAEIHWEGPVLSDVYTRVHAYWNTYPSYEDVDEACPFVTRRDDFRYDLEAGVSIRIHNTVDYEIGGTFSQRSSNCDPYEYDSTSLRTAISFGW